MRSFAVKIALSSSTSDGGIKCENFNVKSVRSKKPRNWNKKQKQIDVFTKNAMNAFWGK